jgi:ribosome-binding factor A
MVNFESINKQKMDSRRQQRIAQLLQEEFSSMLMSDIKSYLMGTFATLTFVNVSSDLGIARFNISILASSKKQEVIDNLNGNKAEIRKVLGNRMRSSLRIIPDLIFHLDDRLDYVDKMDDLFKKIKEEDEKI